MDANLDPAAAIQIAIESDFGQSSTNIGISGVTKVSLGTISSPGDFAVRFLPDIGSSLLTDFLVLPVDDTHFEILSSKFINQPVPTDLLTRLKQGFTVDRAKKAFSAVGPKWLQDNATATGSMVMVCIFAGATAETGITVIQCGKNVGGLAAGLAAAIGGEMLRTMNGEGLISDPEFATLSKTFDGANLIVQLVLEDNDTGRLLTFVGNDLEKLSDDETAKFGIHTGFDSVKKYLFLLDLRPKQ